MIDSEKYTEKNFKNLTDLVWNQPYEEYLLMLDIWTQNIIEIWESFRICSPSFAGNLQSCIRYCIQKPGISIKHFILS